jgi:FkbM family methyltransferase
MNIINRPFFIIACIFIIKLVTVFYLVDLTKCVAGETMFGIASLAGDANSYITPIDNFLNEGSYYYEGSFAGRMPYLGIVYLLFRLFFSKIIALGCVVLLQILVESIAIYYLAKLCELLIRSKRAFSFFIFLSIISLNVTIFSFYMLSESFGISFLCLFVYNYYIYLTNKRTTKQLIFTGFLLTLSILFKPYLFLLFLPIGIEFIWYYRHNNFILLTRKTIIASLLVFLPFIILDTPWIIRNYILTSKVVPFQQDINAGYDYPSSTLSVYKFIQTIGESYIYWDKRSAGCYFEPKDKFPCEYIFPKRIFSENLTLQKIEEARNVYLEYQINPNDSLNNLIVQKFNALSDTYKNDKFISYYLIKPFILCRHFIFHSGSYYLPIKINSQCYQSYQWWLKVSQSIMYYLSLSFGFLGTILLIRKNPSSFIIFLIPIYLIILFPIVLERTEFRYFHLAYPFLLIGLTVIIFIMIELMPDFKRIYRLFYRNMPFKKEIYSILRVFNLPESIYKHLHFEGIITIKVDAKNHFKMYHLGASEENSLFWEGIDNGWEKTSLKLWRKLCLDTPVVLDIGANTGLYSLVTKTLNPAAKVYAFEPLPKVLEYLNFNIEINKFDIVVVPKAASNYNGKATVFLTEGHDFCTSVTVNKSLLSETTPQKELEITTIRLVDFIQKSGMERIDLMKIDVETHEPEVLEGMGEYINQFKPDFLIEIWDEECASKLNIFFRDKGYLYFDIDDKKDTIIQKAEIVKSSYWNYLICKPETAKKIGLI